MAPMTYGTPEFYKEQFMDFVGDAQADHPEHGEALIQGFLLDQADHPEHGEALIQGFLLALDDWMQYHTTQAAHYGYLQERVRSALGVS